MSSYATARQIKGSIAKILAEGFWFCNDCMARCEFEEGEQGQPAHCANCGSHDIHYNRPALERAADDGVCYE